MLDDFVTIDWTKDGAIRLIDQTRLPLEEVYVECRTLEEVARAIRTMQVRGAPAIGVAAAMGLAIGFPHDSGPDLSGLPRGSGGHGHPAHADPTDRGELGVGRPAAPADRARLARPALT